MSLVAADALAQEGSDLYAAQRFDEALVRFERAVTVYPAHHLGWKGLGHVLLSLGRAPEAARAFDRAIGYKPRSATTLWGGALAHAETGNQLMARTYLERALEVQPSWLELAQSQPALASLLRISAMVGPRLRAQLGAYSTRGFRASQGAREVQIARVLGKPDEHHVSHVSIGLADHVWAHPQRPRVELIGLVRADGDVEAMPAILANACFHMMESGFFPEPGAMARDVVSVLRLGPVSERLPHLFFDAPRPWPLSLPLVSGPPVIVLSHAIPIAEAEYAFWKAHGTTALLQRLVQPHVRLGDLRRAPVV